MTAINLFAQPSRVSLITDGAAYDGDGYVREFASKVVVHHRYRIAIAVSGRQNQHRLAELLGPAASPEEAIAMLPTVARQLRAEGAADDGGLEPAGLNDFQLFAAWWHRKERRGAGAILSTNQAYFGANYRPFTLMEVDQVSSPRVGSPVDLHTFDPRRDGLALIEAQRHDFGPHGRYWIGGFAELTTIDRDGVCQERLVTWPDRVGERISP